MQSDSKIIRAPTSCTLSQDTLRHWEKAARESTICHQAARLSRCLSKVQQGLQTQLRALQSENIKGKSAGRAEIATDELQYLINFSYSVTQRVAKAMEHLSDFSFVSLAHVKSELIHWQHVKLLWTCPYCFRTLS